MEKIAITTEMLRNADDYIPLMRKQELAETIAEKCIVKVRMSAQIDGVSEPISAPDRFQERRELVAMYQMGIFVTYYLKREYYGDNDLQVAAKVYDDWAGSHVFNQMERMKTDKDKDVKDKVFNILYDYKEFQWMLRREIETILGHRNDTVARMAVLNTESAAAGMLSAAEAVSKAQGGESSVDETAHRVAEAAKQLEALRSAQGQLAKSKTALEEAKKFSEQKRALVDEFGAKLSAKNGTEAGANVRADK